MKAPTFGKNTTSSGRPDATDARRISGEEQKCSHPNEWFASTARNGAASGSCKSVARSVSAGKDGKSSVIANADLGLQEMIWLRDALGEFISEAEGAIAKATGGTNGQ